METARGNGHKQHPVMNECLRKECQQLAPVGDLTGWQSETSGVRSTVWFRLWRVAKSETIARNTSEREIHGLGKKA